MMLKFGEVELYPDYEPPRPMLLPRKRVQVRRSGSGVGSEYILDWGLEPFRVIQFASSPTQGFLTHDQKEALIVLYITGRRFILVTDLLKPKATPPFETIPDQYIARFELDSGSAPLFTPAIPDGSLYYFDLKVRLQ